LKNLPRAVVLLLSASNAIEDVTPLVPRLLTELQALTPRTFLTVPPP